MFDTLKETVKRTLKDPGLRVLQTYTPLETERYPITSMRPFMRARERQNAFGGYTGEKPFVIILAIKQFSLGDNAIKPYNNLCAGKHSDPSSN